MRLLFALAVSVSAAAFAAPPISASDFATGALSFLVSTRCESENNPSLPAMEWTGLKYAPKKQPEWGTKSVNRCYVGSPILIDASAAGAVWLGLDAATRDSDPSKALMDPTQQREALKKLFGLEPIDPERVAPDKMPAWDAKKLSAMFDRLYVKPTETIGKVTAQQVYDFFFKTFLATFAHDAAKLKAALPPAKLTAQVKAYQAAAREGGASFNGPAYLEKAAATALPEADQSPRLTRTFGTLLRRTADGSWPTVTRLLKRVLKDYDPAVAKELEKAL